jgi:hypothetical protein
MIKMKKKIDTMKRKAAMLDDEMGDNEVKNIYSLFYKF